jgi:hypothetical protein
MCSESATIAPVPVSYESMKAILQRKAYKTFVRIKDKWLLAALHSSQVANSGEQP